MFHNKKYSLMQNRILYIYIYIYLLQICLVCLSVCVSLTKSLCNKMLTWVIYAKVKDQYFWCPSVCPSVCLSVRLSVHPSVCLSVRPSVLPSVVCFYTDHKALAFMVKKSWSVQRRVLHWKLLIKINNKNKKISIKKWNKWNKNEEEM